MKLKYLLFFLVFLNIKNTFFHTINFNNNHINFGNDYIGEKILINSSNKDSLESNLKNSNYNILKKIFLNKKALFILISLAIYKKEYTYSLIKDSSKFIFYLASKSKTIFLFTKDLLYKYLF